MKVDSELQEYKLISLQHARGYVFHTALHPRYTMHSCIICIRNDNFNKTGSSCATRGWRVCLMHQMFDVTTDHAVWWLPNTSSHDKHTITISQLQQMQQGIPQNTQEA